MTGSKSLNSLIQETADRLGVPLYETRWNAELGSVTLCIAEKNRASVEVFARQLLGIMPMHIGVKFEFRRTDLVVAWYVGRKSAGGPSYDERGRIIEAESIIFSPESCLDEMAVFLDSVEEVDGERPASFGIEAHCNRWRFAWSTESGVLNLYEVQT